MTDRVSNGTLNLTEVHLDSGDLVTLSQKVRSLYPILKFLPVMGLMSEKLPVSKKQVPLLIVMNSEPALSPENPSTESIN